MSTVIIALIVAALVFLAARSLYKENKSGGACSACGGSCSGCGAACAPAAKEKAAEKETVLKAEAEGAAASSEATEKPAEKEGEKDD